ncbi:MAG: hypothetical protein PHX21_12590 [bacterium]|nr:hypothetical protein [bacterium]
MVILKVTGDQNKKDIFTPGNAVVDKDGRVVFVLNSPDMDEPIKHFSGVGLNCNYRRFYRYDWYKKEEYKQYVGELELKGDGNGKKED